jgi:uncharacterized membrane protein YqiK
MNNCVKTVSSIVHNWNIIYTVGLLIHLYQIVLKQNVTNFQLLKRYAGHSDRNALNMGSIYEQLIDLLTNGANLSTFIDNKQTTTSYRSTI